MFYKLAIRINDDDSKSWRDVRSCRHRVPSPPMSSRWHPRQPPSGHLASSIRSKWGNSRGTLERETLSTLRRALPSFPLNRWGMDGEADPRRKCTYSHLLPRLLITTHTYSLGYLSTPNPTQTISKTYVLCRHIMSAHIIQCVDEMDWLVSSRDLIVTSLTSIRIRAI